MMKLFGLFLALVPLISANQVMRDNTKLKSSEAELTEVTDQESRQNTEPKIAERLVHLYSFMIKVHR